MHNTYLLYIFNKSVIYGAVFLIDLIKPIKKLLTLIWVDTIVEIYQSLITYGYEL